RMARMSLRSPASWATETTFQSRYPGGISVTKTASFGVGSVLAKGLPIMAPFLSDSRGLEFCACAFSRMMTAMVRTEAIVTIATKFLVFIFLSDDLDFGGWMTDFLILPRNPARQAREFND